MTTTRRAFLHTSLAAGAMLGFGGLVSAVASAAPRRQNANSKRILILGGTGFLGPKLVEVAQERGHEITVFNRGRTEQRIGRLPGKVERLIGDRDPDKGDGLKALDGRAWDVVIDNSGFYPRMVGASAQLLAPNVKQYIFVSSISAYAKSDMVGGDESAELAKLADPTVETMGASFENYGGLKVLCEQAVETALPGRATIVRPGFIVGPGDPTDRFTYWPVRVERGGEVLAPGTPDDPIQIIDVRDLAAWMIHLAEQGITGTFNACGPEKKLTMGQVLSACKDACSEGSPGRNATITWVSAQFLESHPEPIQLPIWVPPMGATAGFHTWSNARAVKAGLTFRPVLETCKDLLAWWPKEVERRQRVTKQMIDDALAKGEPPPQMDDPTKLRAGISPEVESKVLEDWRTRKTG